MWLTVQDDNYNKIIRLVIPKRFGNRSQNKIIRPEMMMNGPNRASLFGHEKISFFCPEHKWVYMLCENVCNRGFWLYKDIKIDIFLISINTRVHLAKSNCPSARVSACLPIDLTDFVISITRPLRCNRTEIYFFENNSASIRTRETKWESSSCFP